ncbi:FAD/NAD(P)-binding protein [Oenococcus alcoholitolerans]|uniref:FAD/NAD(P)-binding protein n=1 Tax=Oenococcus alcoholitolerans TaxID=931074 RepID=UPI003F6ECC44
MANRIAARFSKTDKNVSIKLFDPYGAGGRVWSPDIKNNSLLVTNTVVSQIDFFIDKSVKDPGPIFKGKNLYEWLKDDAEEYIKKHAANKDYLKKINVEPNDYVVRGLVGLYQAWFYDNTKIKSSNNVLIDLEKEEIKSIDKKENGFELFFENKSREKEFFDFVILALGFGNDKLTDQEKTLSDFANRHGLIYKAPFHPSQVDLLKVPANKPIIIRGLGLSFFDFMALLTEGRGGEFIKNNDQKLIYKKSGKEPIIYAGSRSGIPFRARGLNQKEPSEQYKALFFTIKNLKKKENKKGSISYRDFFDLFNKEIQYKYYLNLSNDEEFQKKFGKIGKQLVESLVSQPIDSFPQTAKKFQIPNEYIWDWKKILDPVNEQKINKEDFQKWLLKYLNYEIIDAKKGNKDAPLAGAFDILRDCRETIRSIIENDYFAAEDFKKFLKQFSHISSFLSVGPPLVRIEQLKALMEAGVVKILGPEIKVENSPRKKCFFATSIFKEKIYSETLLEARLPKIDLSLFDGDLRENLKKRGWFRKTVIKKSNGNEGLILDGVLINKRNFQVIDKNGQEISGLYSFGIPHEPLIWFTTILPRQGVNTIIQKESAKISRDIFKKTIMDS